MNQELNSDLVETNRSHDFKLTVRSYGTEAQFWQTLAALKHDLEVRGYKFDLILVPSKAEKKKHKKELKQVKRS